MGYLNEEFFKLFDEFEKTLWGLLQADSPIVIGKYILRLDFEQTGEENWDIFPRLYNPNNLKKHYYGKNCYEKLKKENLLNEINFLWEEIKLSEI